MTREFVNEPTHGDNRLKYSAFSKSGKWDRYKLPVRKMIPGTDYIDQKVTKKQGETQKVIKKIFDSCQATDPDPHKIFEPSPSLTILVNEHLDYPDEDEARSFNIVRKFYGQSAITRFDIAELSAIISREVEGYLANLAKRSEKANVQIKISKNGRFTSDISLELIDRLQLDAYDARPVLDQLFRELFQFAFQISRKRSWGEIVALGPDLLLKINNSSFEFPNFGSLDEEGWITL